MKSPLANFFFCLALLLPGINVCSAASTNKLPIPDDATQQKSLAQVKEVYNDDLALAKQPEQKAAVAQKMLQAALPEQGDTNIRYALLMLTKNTAVEGADLDTAIAAIDVTDKSYQIDPLAQKTEAAVGVAKLVRAPQDIKNLVDQLDDMIDQTINADRYDLASELTTASIAAARLSPDPTMVRLASFHMQQIKDAQAAYADVKDSLAALQAKPLDPEANFKVGKFRCFYKGNWDIGIPMLALGNDTTLRDLAQREFEGPVDGDATVALGDDWWDLSEKEIGTAKAQLQHRAAHWYQEALPQSTGVVKGKLEGRLAMVDAQEAPGRRLIVVPLVDTEAQFRAAWREAGRSGYEKKNKTVSTTGRGDLGEIVANMSWLSITLEVCSSDINPNGFAVHINGTSLSLKGLADAAKGQFIPMSITYNKSKKIISLTVENHLLDQAAVLQDDFDKKLAIGFFWPGQTSRFQIRNVNVLTDTPPEAAPPARPPEISPPPKPPQAAPPPKPPNNAAPQLPMNNE